MLRNNYFFREKDIDEKLARMNTDLAAWKTRLDNRKKQAQNEIEKRTKILAEVSVLLSRYMFKTTSEHPIFVTSFSCTMSTEYI